MFFVFFFFFLQEFDLWLTFGRSVFNPTTYIYESKPVQTIQSEYKHRLCTFTRTLLSHYETQQHPQMNDFQ